ncbi:MAG: hypothetical protein M9893_10970 [Pyrinomonadaceae bacterium]|nr:hypothetical protein [Pyrinomonadaceae bacterium]
MRSKILAAFVISVCTVLFAADAAAQKRASVSGPEVTGTFRMNFTGKFKGNSNEIQIQALGRGKLRIGMMLVYPYFVGKEQTVNIGILDGEASITGDTAVYESDEFGECRIIITFVRPGTIKVEQQASDFACGFGHNVTADGTYTKVSSAKPKF